MDLYQPLYVQRPEVQLELYQSLRPQTNEMALDQAAAPEEATAEKAMAAPRPRWPGRPRRRRSRASRRALAAGARTSPSPRGSPRPPPAAQVGELFQYVIDKPVTLPRQQSAMLPILNQQVTR